jgi:hypothetical protein
LYDFVKKDKKILKLNKNNFSQSLVISLKLDIPLKRDTP